MKVTETEYNPESTHTAVAQKARERNYWLEKLSGDLEKTSFPPDPGKSRKNETVLRSIDFSLTGELFSKLTRLGNNSDIRLYIILMTLVVLLLEKYTGKRDIVVGAPIYRQEIDGEFINKIIVLRNSIKENMSFKELLLQVSQTNFEAVEHVNYPLETIPYELDISFTGSEFPLFDVAVLLDSLHDKSYIQHLDLNVIFSFSMREDRIDGLIEYNRVMYERNTIERIISHFINLAGRALDDIDAKIADIPIMSDEEIRRFIVDINATQVTDAGYPGGKMIHQLFREQVDRTPNHLALQHDGHDLTYKDLNEAADLLARRLTDSGVRTETIVAILLDRSVELVVSILAVLKAGGAYLPIDTEYLISRIDYLLADSNTNHLIARKDLADKVKFTGIVLDVRCPLPGPHPGKHDTPDHGGGPGSLAYVMYTSGSTGKPKGVMIRHSSVVNYVWWAARTYVKGEKLNFPLYSSISFDLTVTSLFTPLITGNTILIYDGEEKNFLIEDIIDENKVGVVKLTPSHLYLIKYRDLRHSNIKCFIVGGEIFETRIARNIADKFHREIEIYNEYGPTEATVGCLIYKFNPTTDNYTSIPIGIPIAETRIYLLDNNQRPVPVGVTGEIYVSGKGIARGYLNRPELTAEKFIDNPFEEDERMYVTGDLACWLPGGDLEFLGRRDQQVKIRGYRIELGEIEQQLLQYEHIKEAVVIAREPGEKSSLDEKQDQYISAYFVSDNELQAGDLREYMLTYLDDYMVPQFFVQLEKIPLTSNGKIDKKALPIPEIKKEKNFVAPGDELEETLVDIWSDVLRIDRDVISIDTSFFELGGQSLKQVNLISRIHKEFNVKIPLAEIFENRTVRELSRFIKGARKETFFSIEPVEKREYYEMSSAQIRMYILRQMDPMGTVYNVPFLITLAQEIDKGKVENVFRQLIERHEALRTSFIMVENNPVQKINEHVDFEVEYYDRENEPVSEILQGFIRPFDLARAPIFRVGIIKLETKKYILMVDIHHIINDGVSTDIMSSEFGKLYMGESLPALRIQYKDFSLWQNSETVQEQMKEQEAYWLKEFEQDIPDLDILTDFPRPPVQSFEGSGVGFRIEGEEASDLIRMVGERGITLYMVLVSALNILLSKLSGQEDIVIGSPVGGRRHDDLAPIMGMFVNTLAMRNYPKGEKTIDEFLGTVKEKTLKAFENQECQFENLLEKLDLKKDTGRNPLFVVMFSWVELIRDTEFKSAVKVSDADREYKFDIPTAKFDMHWMGRENNSEISLFVNYCSKLFKEETILTFIDLFKDILSLIVKSPHLRISDIDIIPGEEKKKLLYDFNNTEGEFPRTKTIHRLFEEQAAKTPQGIAVRASVDLGEIHEELSSEEINPGMFERLETCCFKKNSYIFQCDLSRFDETNTFTLLKTYQHNIAVLNSNTVKLLDLFDGEKNLAAVYSLFRSDDLRLAFLIYSLNIDDVLEISYSFQKKEEFLLENTFDVFVRLVKSLYRLNFIELVNVDRHAPGYTLDTPVHDYFETAAPTVVKPGDAVKNKEVLDNLLAPKKNLSEADILLLGDTPGQSTSGLLYLASYLRRNGIKAYCHFNDSNWETALLRENIEALLMKIKPRIVGVSMKWFLHIARVLEMCRIIKEYSKKNSLDIKVVLGGNSASFFREEIIRDENVDYIIRGDGELPFLKLCRGEKDIPNCVYKEGTRIIENPITYVQGETNSSDIYLSHMDEIMISDYSCVFGIFFIFTQKGCRKNCHYCGGANRAQRIAFNRPGLFRRNVSEVRKDIIESMTYASTIYFLFDDYSNESLLEYCEEIWEGIDLTNHFGFLSNVIPPSPELIEYSNKVFKYVYWNLDMASMSERHREQLFSEGMVKFQPTDKEVLEMFDECEKYDNNEILINIITGLPYFSRDDIEDSKRIMSYIINNYSCFGEFFWARLHAEPGAPVIKDVDKYGMYSLAEEFEDFLEYSKRSLEEFKYYPNVDNFIYPYIYFKDEEMNSVVSKYYAETYTQADQYRRTRKRKAVVFEDLSYRELNKRANRLAAELRKKRVEPATVVGIMADRSPDMIVGLLGILKAGGAYLPLDPEYPEDRVKYMLKESNVRLLLSQAHLEDRVDFNGDFIDLGKINSPLPANSEPVEPPPAVPGNTVNESDPAYIIFTSGSTGNPKGVMIEHRSIVNTLTWRKNRYAFDENDVVLQIPSFSFDSSVEDIFTPLISGSRLVLMQARHRFDMNYLRTLFKNTGITHFLIVPSLYKTYLEEIPDSMKGMKHVTVAGEHFTGELVKRHFEKLSHVMLCNEYGPTENSVCSTLYEFHPGGTKILIGAPIRNVRCYILGKNDGRLCFRGVTGELYLSGAGISRGYLNDPELTAEKFVYLPRITDQENRFFEKAPAVKSKFYRTGDLARWMPGGEIEFMGRIDHQVKIRGFRIELEEIEHHLLQYDGIKEVVVTAKTNDEGNGKHLYAYLVSETAHSAAELKKYLTNKLPQYMVPSHFIRIDEIPLTPNGKIDRKALDSSGTRMGADEEFIAPQNDIEKKIAGLWKEVLHLDKVGINDNFFDLGGTSLDVIKLSSKINETFNINESVILLFRYTTILSFAQYLSREKKGAVTAGDDKSAGQSAAQPLEKVKESRMAQRNRRRGTRDVAN